MYNLIRYKNIFFIISLLVILPGLYSLIRYGLRPSIDFTGGSLVEIKNEKLKSRESASFLSEAHKIKNNLDAVKDIFTNEGVEVITVQETGEGSYLFRSKSISAEQKNRIIDRTKEKLGEIEETRYESVGPVIGKELTEKAIQAMVVASLAIVLYIAYAFREIPKPYSPWKFGLTAVAALIHDVLVVVGLFSILGHLYHVEIDALFVTALLTVIGFSVHDTIVVFDRIRENLRKEAGKKSFSEVVNESLLQTLVRSLNTSLTVLLVLLALILFGGESIRWFVVALFVGILSGTYSSIFNAAPLLVVWEEYKRNK